jgi:hypothetical protein
MSCSCSLRVRLVSVNSKAQCAQLPGKRRKEALGCSSVVEHLPSVTKAPG